jgi:hypothetical protein
MMRRRLLEQIVAAVRRIDAVCPLARESGKV